MSWSNDAPPRFSLHFDGAEGPAARLDGGGRKLVADTLEDAKLEATILYACLNLPTPPPSYRIVKGARSVVYRYPEPGAPVQAVQPQAA